MNSLLLALLAQQLLHIQRPPRRAPVYQTANPIIAAWVAKHMRAPFTVEQYSEPRKIEPWRAPLPKLEDIQSNIRY